MSLLFNLTFTGMMGIVIATYCEVLIALMVAGRAEGPTPPDDLPEPERPPELALAWSEVPLDWLAGVLLFVGGSLWRGVGWDPLHMSQLAHWVHSDLMCPLPRHPKHNLCFISSETLSLWRIFRNFRQACKECWQAQCRHGGRKAPGNFTFCAGFRVVADTIVALFFAEVEMDLPLFSDSSLTDLPNSAFIAILFSLSTNDTKLEKVMCLPCWWIRESAVLAQRSCKGTGNLLTITRRLVGYSSSRMQLALVIALRQPIRKVTQTHRAYACHHCVYWARTRASSSTPVLTQTNFRTAAPTTCVPQHNQQLEACEDSYGSSPWVFR